MQLQYVTRQETNKTFEKKMKLKCFRLLYLYDIDSEQEQEKNVTKKFKNSDLVVWFIDI